MTYSKRPAYLMAMELPISTEQEARLVQIAQREGKTIEQLIVDAALRLFDRKFKNAKP